MKYSNLVCSRVFHLQNVVPISLQSMCRSQQPGKNMEIVDISDQSPEVYGMKTSL